MEQKKNLWDYYHKTRKLRFARRPCHIYRTTPSMIIYVRMYVLDTYTTPASRASQYPCLFVRLPGTKSGTEAIDILYPILILDYHATQRSH